MDEAVARQLTPGQAAVLKRILRAGYRFVRYERFARYLGVEKEGFVALLDTSEGRVSVLGRVGYQLGEGIAVLVQRAEGPAFIWKNETVAATPELLERYEQIKEELSRLTETAS
jgi:hypothetical protein